MMPLYMEYPEFSRSICYLERELYAGGKQLSAPWQPQHLYSPGNQLTLADI